MNSFFQNPRPGSYRGDDKYDLAGPNRMLERARNRMQDDYTGDEETMRGEVAAEAATARKDAARREHEQKSMLLGERIHGWWSRHFR